MNGRGKQRREGRGGGGLEAWRKQKKDEEIDHDKGGKGS